VTKADVAELVDARDLKSLGRIDLIENSFKTTSYGIVETDADTSDLQNI
jgi:hypothetical protein